MLKPVGLSIALAIVCSPLLADDDPHGGPPRCVPISIPQKAIEDRKGKWIELTAEQWQFLRGIFAMNPLTPPGLPYGDRAVEAKIDGHEGALVFFIDGDKACTPMAIPDSLIPMMDDVATGAIHHEGAGL
jgi:hypothetical protein